MNQMDRDIILGLENVLAHVKGEKPAARETVYPLVDVVATRKKLGLSQAAFAAQFGFSVQNIRNWEQGARQPSGPARTLLLIIDHNPAAVREALTTS